MKKVTFKKSNGSSDIVRACYELEAEDLYPAFKQNNFATTQEITARSFASLQLRAKNAVKALINSKNRNILMLCAVNRIDQCKVAAAIVSEVSDKSVLIAKAPSRRELFGDASCKSVLLSYDVVIIPCVHLNDHPKWIGLLEDFLDKNSHAKLILTGDGGDCAELMVMWPQLEHALQADLVLEFPSVGGMELMAGLIKHYQKKDPEIKDFDEDAVRLLCMYACRESGDRRWLGLPEEKIRSLVEDASFFAKGETVAKRHVLKSIAAMDFRINFLAESELRDHRDRQILISTQGAVVGQINGLSVIETAGTSYEFGEPVRITATARAGGEGDVIDIERKAELAGQIHAKAMMIINGYLTKEFGSDQPLPMSASLVFEQSYSEVDGDSASLTGLCAVISCLAKVPIRQDLAVTGAVDQFGDVQPVGGVNEKIEGFFKVCRLHGFTGTQGVVIPFSCVNQLVLRPSVVNAVKKGVFHIYTVTHVNDAVKLLTTMDWDADDGRDTIRQRIVDHLYEVANGKEEIPWWKFWQKNED